MSNYMIGIVTFNRYKNLNVLLHSLRHIDKPILIVDANNVKEDIDYDVSIYHNDIKGYTTVVHNKNIIIHNFLKNDYDYLFLVEDDIKILDSDIFEKYIDISKKYNLPHMNFGGRPNKNEITYDLNSDITIFEKLQGCFSFYTKECLEKVGMMNQQLCHNCWEHVEHTARIHQTYNYQPNFYHFPDVKNAWHSILMQDIESSINKTYHKHIQKDKQVMLSLLNWKSMPYVDIKRLNIKSIKSYK